jgi:ribonuclease HI
MPARAASLGRVQPYLRSVDGHGNARGAVPFRAFRLRGEKILARVDDEGKVHTGSDGRVDVLYKPGGKIYRASLRNLTPDDDARIVPDGEAAAGESAPGREAPAKKTGRILDGEVLGSTAGEALPADAILAYTDGACTGNPGPMGIGMVLIDPKTGERRERSEFLGEGTNNIAELVAIQRALELAPEGRALAVHSDSSYALGLLGLGWKAKANQALVAQIRVLAEGRADLRLVKVAGHAGVVENERADELARTAVERRSTSDSALKKPGAKSGSPGRGA